LPKGGEETKMKKKKESRWDKIVAVTTTVKAYDNYCHPQCHFIRDYCPECALFGCLQWESHNGGSRAKRHELCKETERIANEKETTD
jgi:hypothetical protein